MAVTNLRKMALDMVGPALAHYAKDEMLEAVAAQKKSAESDAADAAKHAINKLCSLKLSRGVALLQLANPEYPTHAAMCEALVGPVLEGTDFDGDDEDAVTSGRKIVRRMVKGAVGTFAQLLGVYVHEHSHAAVGRSFGYAPTVHASVKLIEVDSSQGTGLGFEVRDGTCRHATDEPIPAERKAAISAAGFMGEHIVPTLAFIVAKDGEGEKARKEITTDANFWNGLFLAIHRHDEGGDDTPDKHNEFTTKSGAERDARDLFNTAPTKAERHAAIVAAGEVIDKEADAIWTVALDNTISHMRVLHDALKLRTIATMLVERAADGEYGMAVVTEHASAKPTLQ